jgi:hypothetical protein
MGTLRKMYVGDAAPGPQAPGQPPLQLAGRCLARFPTQILHFRHLQTIPGIEVRILEGV